MRGGRLAGPGPAKAVTRTAPPPAGAATTPWAATREEDGAGDGEDVAWGGSGGRRGGEVAEGEDEGQAGGTMIADEGGVLGAMAGSVSAGARTATGWEGVFT